LTAATPLRHPPHTEADTEPPKKTTILFPAGLHRHLARTARQQHTSLGDLVRKACEARYGSTSSDERLAAVRALGEMSLAVADPATMKRQSIAKPKVLKR
jgi:hypothetical protein